ncbi:hypothetical protein LPB03_02995 [Polaribacter vadi]|uniref:Outer membrane protein beta-barrel domain-containing protein n=1 Tax=Polaribacter vadi TaxID=1774273 RepID=A0A1B8TYM9_9FLAO|nr:hypothetical protein [Polaribacter vadi]AOW16495.1 hypothetical protein LPB03_02995 [Polaribacter vadi]OBY64599.1 hypothetical protein LPB3_09500 [Polaribacter vadi]
MKKLATLLFFLFVFTIQAQHDILLTYDSDKNDISADRTEIVSKREYNIVLDNVNSAIVKATVKLRYFDIASDIPEVLKPILNISSSDQISFDKDNKSMFMEAISEIEALELLDEEAILYINKKDSIKENKGIENKLSELEFKKLQEHVQTDILENLYSLAKEKSALLDTLTNKINNLYTRTLVNPDTAKALIVEQDILQNFRVSNKNDLIIEVSRAVYFIKATEVLFKLRLEKIDTPSIKITMLYAYLKEIETKLSVTEYIKDIKFLYVSKTAKSIITLESFKAKNAGLQAEVVLINKRTNDTIKTQKINFYTKQNVTFDFSSGFFHSNKVDQGYYLEKRDTLINNVLKENPKKGDISIGALGHISWRYTSSFKAGFNLGASISPFDGKTRYLIGVSAIFGRQNQIGFNIGTSFTKIKELSNAVKEDNLGLYVNSSVTEIPTFDRIRRGIYFGITYNVTSTKKFKDE